ncbi:IBR domain, Zinc finger, RING/FYVE/PHD-type, E3 ubiquitin ligase RBR family [Artemisia annua]|uniref:IBR domain, Zinc finger, RING/FYVE/PHD-type, E3 ubiquitin ligase RBR family n=1 Tax=Artemisia annua TaxID=35608 RepID=A0A2U1KVN0_ARTAN|nr:IBR domain, Zinc finger, RING/FYVE/PHD-type, E3 ubiquitin ligase RBR family [Artemisia annua]
MMMKIHSHARSALNSYLYPTKDSLIATDVSTHFARLHQISHKLFKRWCDALCESTVLGFDLVYCPNNECSELIKNEFNDGDVKRCVCPSCLKPLCYLCKAPWHDGYTCEELRDGNNVDFDVVCKKNGWTWKRCPK